MEYLPADLSPRERYKILTSFVLPRPIAWVTSMGETGVVNAAPFSFFNVLGEDPPLCVFAINLRPDGRIKDTLVNIRRSGEFVVHITDEPLAQAMHDTGGDFPPEISEPDHLGLTLAPSSTVLVPRLTDAPFAMESPDLEDHRRQRRPPIGIRRGRQLLHPRRIMGSREDAGAHGTVPPGRTHVRRPLLPHQ